MMGAMTKEEAEEVIRRLEVAEVEATKKYNDYTAIQLRAEVGDVEPGWS